MSRQSKKKFTQPVSTVVRKKPVDPPVFSYTSECCEVPAKKKPLVIDHTVEVKDHNTKEHSLGTWNCTRCRRKCRVTRSKYKAPEAPAKTLAEKLDEEENNANQEETVSD